MKLYKLKGDVVFDSFFEEPIPQPSRKRYRQADKIIIGVNLLPINIQEEMKVEWWGMDYSRNINKELLEKINIGRIAIKH